ncbi:MAG: hypothetical protein J7647_26935 [Cyanobacteria bacterium SBLK]|nr:hypothetical protein [Cyanobacteria bacterium SBLK]
MTTTRNSDRIVTLSLLERDSCFYFPIIELNTRDLYLYFPKIHMPQQKPNPAIAK